MRVVRFCKENKIQGNAIKRLSSRYQIIEEKRNMLLKYIVKHFFNKVASSYFVATIATIAMVCAIFPGAERAVALPVSHYAVHSVLSSGYWYKIAVTGSGIYEISYNQLREWGIYRPIAGTHIWLWWSHASRDGKSR